MFDRPTLEDTSHGVDLRQPRAEKHIQDEGASRVSTDSDLDLESEDEDDYRTTFSNLLLRKLAAVEWAQQQHVLREEKVARSTPPQQLTGAADDSYWAKMRRVNQWRQSTHQSETSSDYSPSASVSASRKRRLSDASVPTATKRARLTALSPAPPGSPFFPRLQMCPLDSATDEMSDPGSYPRSYGVHTESSIHQYSGMNTLHVCSACDAAFASRQRLRRHGRGAWTPDACRVAVTYGLE